MAVEITIMEGLNFVLNIITLTLVAYILRTTKKRYKNLEKGMGGYFKALDDKPQSHSSR